MSSDQIDALARLRNFGAATVYEALGKVGAMDPAIKPLDPRRRVVGRAFTVDSAPGDNLAIHHGASRARAGDVLVVDAKAFVDAGPWGDVLSEYAMSRGIAGLVIDGAVRDSQAIVGMGFPVFSRGICIKGTAKVNAGRVNTPIVCGGVAVRPGDVIIGDADGVTVLPNERLEEACEASALREHDEDGLRAAIAHGEHLLDLLDLRGAIGATATTPDAGDPR